MRIRNGGTKMSNGNTSMYTSCLGKSHTFCYHGKLQPDWILDS